MQGQFDWFKDYQKIEEQVAIIEMNLERNKRELDRWTSGDLAKLKLNSNSHGSQLEEIIEGLEWELAHQMNELFNIKEVVSKFPGLEHKILIGKYIEGLTLERVAERLGYNTQYIYNRHSQIKRAMNLATVLNA